MSQIAQLLAAPNVDAAAQTLAGFSKVEFAGLLKEVRGLTERADRAEADAQYLRRAFRGAVESDALAITYQTIGSYRAGLLKTLNALDIDATLTRASAQPTPEAA